MRYIPALLILLMACGSGTSERAAGDAAVVSRAPQTAGTASQSSQITVTRNGEVVASYEAPGAAGLLDEGHLTIEMNSPDGRHSLVIEVEDAGAGSFPVTDRTEAGKAVLLFMSDSLPSTLSPKAGTLQLDELTSDRCSGSFTGSLDNGQGDRFQVEGRFQSIPVREL